MKKLVLFLCLSLALAAHAQKQKTEAYINTYKEIAIAEMMRTGVPASITLAQGILESQSGESDLVKGSNNHFGIKCKTEWTGEKIYHDDDAKGECFRVYPSADESFRDHSDFLKTRAHYAFLFKLDPTDYEGWAKGLKKAGYATNPAYPQKLMKLINDYQLQQYSLMAIARLNEPAQRDEVTAVEVKEIKEVKEVEEVTLVKEVKEDKEAENNGTLTEPVIITAAAKKTTTYPQGIFSINHTKVIYATAGTSLLALANQYDLPLGKLIEYNDLEEMDVLDMDRLVFVEKKQKKGSVDFHTVAPGENLHAISQLEGIRLENLLEYNNLKKSTQLSTGEKIYLRTVTQAVVEKPVVKQAKKITS
jgi:LysM repeat protein